jgi:hypothetical protein
MVARLLDDLPVTAGRRAAVALRVAVRGWVGFVEAASLDWLEHGGSPRRPARDARSPRSAARRERAPRAADPRGRGPSRRV